ncbi:aldehyde-activating protein [Pseudomonas sp. SDI]|uniref:GFA family protein n=1 Tax=Pseudomonas sp. SDI TaxID=2170734 RepID=UPI000DE5E3C7|nr:GFA family protein [Pseudomonas sp. SDI]PWB31567.1 aldehyde-activating protein [Pseudomonas sp. SDI]
MPQFEEGGCHCGALRYRLAGLLKDVAHCHCSVCRKVTGGTLVTWLTVPCSAFQWLAGTPQRYDSSPSCVRYFCSRCGAHVALTSDLSPESIDITLTTLDHPERLRPTKHIWTASRLPWLHLDEQLPGEAGETL